MSIFIEHGFAGLPAADHPIAKSLASLNGAVRLQRGAIRKSGRTFTSDEVCVLLDDISTRLEVAARLHKSLAQSESGNGVRLGDVLRDISAMVGELVPHGKLDL